MKHLIDVKELSNRITVARSTIYQWVHEERIPHYRLGRLLRFDEDEVNSWLLRRCGRSRGTRTIDLNIDGRTRDNN